MDHEEINSKILLRFLGETFLTVALIIAMALIAGKYHWYSEQLDLYWQHVIYRMHELKGYLLSPLLFARDAWNGITHEDSVLIFSSSGFLILLWLKISASPRRP